MHRLILWMTILVFITGLWNTENQIIGKESTPPNTIINKSISLESISFNHNFENIPNCRYNPPNYFDAIDICMDSKEDVTIPEFDKNHDKRYPVAYIMGQEIVIIAKFSSNYRNGKTFTVGARTVKKKSQKYHLGDVNEEIVTIKSNGVSDPVCFTIDGQNPKRITSFNQEWNWYWVDDLKKKKNFFGCSKNRIYIIGGQPKIPWGPDSKGKGKKVWAKVLEKSCYWAADETSDTGIINRISQQMYYYIGAFYSNTASSQYSGALHIIFGLQDFLDKMPYVGAVNCSDMAKALVIFSNALGCESSYVHEEMGGNIVKNNINCIKEVGKCWKCNSRFIGHDFVVLKNKYYDASLKIIKSCAQSNAPLTESWLNGFTWEQYKYKLFRKKIADKLTEKPQEYNFDIWDYKNNLTYPYNNSIRGDRYNSIKNIYKFDDLLKIGDDTEIYTNKEIIKVHTDCNRIYENLGFKYKKTERIIGDTYTVFQKQVYTNDCRYGMKIVISLTSQAAKKYLIDRYLDFSKVPITIEEIEDIGDMALLLKFESEGTDISLDFISKNILVFLTASDVCRNNVISYAKCLDKKIKESLKNFGGKNGSKCF